ncbi:MAG: IPT/TIG domain-containing protein [Sphingomonadaceae bacterium]
MPAGTYDVYFSYSPNRVSGGDIGDPQFTILPPPSITSVSPNAGPVSGGKTVTITGAEFQNATSVRFGGIDATSFTIDSATQITAVTPAAGSASAVDVEVTNATGTGKSVGGFSYLSGPSIAGVGTNAGPTTGGTSVAIFGVNLDNATVTFGGVPATITSNSSNQIDVTSPPNSLGMTAIEVTTSGGTATRASGFQYYAQPVVTSITPSGGPRTGGTIVTITGTNFDDVTSVRFGDNTGTNFVLSGSTQITVQAPSGSGATSVDLIFPFSSTRVNNGFNYGDPPTVSSISPNFGLPAGGDSVIIVGSNLNGVTAVSFGGTPASSFTASFSQITAVAPAGAEGSVDVVVTSPVGSATSANGFTYAGEPTISQVSPNAGQSGTSVVITGTNFTGTPTVRFGAANATSVTVNSTTQITAIAPSNATGVFDVSVTTDAGTATRANAFTYSQPPTIVSVSPNSGAPAGGTSVTINGSNLTGATAVKFGTVSATSFTVTNSNAITAITPPGVAGFVNVSVTTPAGTATQPSAFNYASTEPKINGVSPGSGSTAGGNSVSINGQNLLGTTSVTFGGVPALYFSVSNPNQITAYPSAGSLGAVDVGVTSPGGSVSSPNAYSYIDPTAPTVTGLSPSQGLLAGGNQVTISGSNLTGATAVTFGGTAATSFTVVNSGQIVAVAPAGVAAGPATVVVTTPGGSASLSGGYLYVSAASAPTINFVTQANISVDGGTVNISGSNFVGVTAVTFNGVPGTEISGFGSNFLSVIAPAGSVGPVTVAVTTAGGTATRANATNYIADRLPAISAVSPASGSNNGGTNVTITGTNFSAATAVRFGNTPGTSFSVVSPTQITVTTPATSNIGSQNVTISSPGGTSLANADSKFMFTSSLIAAPTISAVSPNSGTTAGGTSVTITGANFGGAASVRFGAVAATSFVANSATQITAVAPAGSEGAVDISVTALGGTVTSNGAFTYNTPQSAPTITAVAPASGTTAGGESVVITGTDFTGATAVRFGGTAATSFTVDSATQITAVTPAGSAGAVDIAVTTSAGTATSNGAFTYKAPSKQQPQQSAPTITAVAPESGTTAGGDSVVITGTDFTGATAVGFGSTAAASFTVDSATQITAVSPSGSAGAVDIAVTTSAGTATSNGAFTYTAPSKQQPQPSAPTITAVAPASGTTAGGDSVVITGTDFTDATAVRFGNTAATSFKVNSTTQITAVSPSGSAGAVDIAVTTSAGTATSNGAFTYNAPQQQQQPQPSAPTITAVAPASGTTAGGSSVVITGTDFTDATAVRFGNTAATSFKVNSTTQITAVSPSGSAGAVDIAVTTSAGSATSNGAFTYTAPLAEPVVAEPVVAAPVVAARAGVAVSYNSAGTAVDLSSSISGVSTGIAVATAPERGTASVAGNVITYTPNADTYGDDSFTYTATGPGGTSAPATVSLTVATPAAPVVAARASVAVAFNSQGTEIDLSSSVSGVASRISVVTPPARGTTQIAGNVVTYTPNADTYGADSFTYTATGPGGTSAPATVSLSVAGSAPRAQSQSGSTSDGQMVSIELTRGAAIGPFTAAQLVSVSPADAVTTVITSTGEGAGRRFFLEATAAPRFGGTVRINYTLTNAFGVSPVGTVTLTVAARPDPSNDPKVRALTDAQVQATRRFGRNQITNFMRRNEQLHSGRARSSQNISVNIIDPARERRPEDSMAPAVMPMRDSDRAAAEDAKAAATAADAASTAPAAQDEKPAGVLGSMSMWVSGAIDIATRDASSFAPKLSASTQGISGGVDFQISKSTAIGFGGGYGNVTTDISDKAAELDATSSLVAFYGSTKLFENGFLDVVAGRGFLDYKTRRRIDGTELTALGSRTGTMNLAAVSFGFNKQVEDLDWSFYSKLEYTDVKLGAYTETTGGSRNNLRLSALDDTSYSAGLGFRLQKAFATGIGAVTPRLRGEWGREFGKANVQYVDYADITDTASRSINLRQTDRNYYEASIGTMIDLKNDWSFDLEYALMYNMAALRSGIKVQLSRAF